MRLRRPLSSSYTGLAIVGLLGSGGFGLISATMFLDRGLGELLIGVLLPIFGMLGGARGAIDYEPDFYYWWVVTAAFMSLLWAILSLGAVLAKPGEDRRLDAAINAKLVQSARGAPLEPEQ